MTITVTPTVDTANWPARVKLSVSASAGETSTTITRLNPDGTTWPVRTNDGNPLALSGGSGLLYDYEAPYGAAVSYSSQESPSTVSAQVTVAVSRVWLVHPGVPSLSQPVRLAAGAFTRRTRPVTQGVFQVMGRTNPVVVSDGARKGVQSTLTVLTQSQADADAIDALMSDAGVVLLNIPTTLGYNFRTCYIAPGEMQSGPVVDKVFETWQTFSWPFYVVDRPAGGSQAQRTWADVIAGYASWSAVKAHYSTWTDVIAGP
ncbi:MAG: hypothetical protein ACXV3F_00330 [Frankiaceae bacterium]